MSDDINQFLSSEQQRQIKALWEDANDALPPETGGELPWGGSNVRLNMAKGIQAVIGIGRIFVAAGKLATFTGSWEDLAALGEAIPKLFMDGLDMVRQKLTPLQYATYLVLAMHVDKGLNEAELGQELDKFATEARQIRFAWFRGLDPNGIDRELRDYKSLQGIIDELAKKKLARTKEGRFYYMPRSFTAGFQGDPET
jgi:hypothetical protein